MASLMYGAGLRLQECVELRVKDINADRGVLMVRDGKGGKDRGTMLPASLQAPLTAHLARAKVQHDHDVASGRGGAALPGRLSAKYPMRRMNGRGNGYFRRRASLSTGRRVSAGAITCTRRWCSGR